MNLSIAARSKLNKLSEYASNLFKLIDLTKREIRKLPLAGDCLECAEGGPIYAKLETLQKTQELCKQSLGGQVRAIITANPELGGERNPSALSRLL